MSGNYRSVFDIIGPIMIGPSSSHTAGPVAIGQAANKLFGGVPKKVTVHYYGSFAQTHRGHGTDYALAAGLQGFAADDPRVPRAPMIAKDNGVDIRFVEEEGESPIGHPNTAILDMPNGDKKVQVSGCSIGGGAIEIRDIVLDGSEIKPSGPLPIVIYLDKEEKHENGIPVTTEMEKVAPFSRKQVIRAKDEDIYVYDVKNYMRDETVKALKDKFGSIICL